MVCGTGGWTGPKPGDPDNNIVLTAQTVFGGIEVEWTYPSTNPHAVAYIILYRGTSPNYFQAANHKIVSGNSYFDRIRVTEPVQYFYWIRVVSINGTLGEVIGPASAFATPSIGELIEDLTGRIDEGLLAETLRTPIERIPLIEVDLAAEAQARIANSSNLSNLIGQIETEYGNVQTLLLNEVQNRQDAVSSVVQSMDLMYADFEDQTAAILAEQVVMADDISSLAAQVTTLTAAAGGDFATLLQNYETAVDAQAARAGLYTTLTSNYEGHVATLLQDYETTTTATTARGNLRTQIQSEYEGHVSNVLVNYQTIAAANYAQGQLVIQLQNSFGNYVSNALTNYYTKSEADYAIGEITNGAQAYTDEHLVAVEEKLTGWIDDSRDDIRQLGALYTVRVNVDGLVGGFGVFNDGQTIDAGFDVDTFWVGRTNANRVKPFIIQDGVVYMDSAMIRQLTADQIDTRGLTIRDMAGNVILGSGTGLNWDQIVGEGRPEDGATVGADASNLRVGVSGNLLPNSDFTSGIQNWVISFNPNNDQNYTISLTQGGGTVIPRGVNALRFSRTGSMDGAATEMGLVYSREIPVLPNTRYELSAYMAVRYCTGYLGIVFSYYNGDTRVNINTLRLPDVSTAGGPSLADLTRVGQFITTPANATVARLIVRGSATTSSNPDVFITRILFAQALPNQQTISNWYDGPRTGAFAELNQINPTNVTTYIANAAIGNAQIRDLAVSTLKIQNEAVVINRFYQYGHGAPDYITFSLNNDVVLGSYSFDVSGLAEGETQLFVLNHSIYFDPRTTGRSILRFGLVHPIIIGNDPIIFNIIQNRTLGNGRHTITITVRLVSDFMGTTGSTTNRTCYVYGYLSIMGAKR